MAESQTAVGV